MSKFIKVTRIEGTIEIVSVMNVDTIDAFSECEHSHAKTVLIQKDKTRWLIVEDVNTIFKMLEHDQ